MNPTDVEKLTLDPYLVRFKSPNINLE